MTCQLPSFEAFGSRDCSWEGTRQHCAALPAATAQSPAGSTLQQLLTPVRVLSNPREPSRTLPGFKRGWQSALLREGGGAPAQTCPGVKPRAGSCREGLQAPRAPVPGQIAFQSICILQIDLRRTGLLPPSVLLPPPASCSHRSLSPFLLSNLTGTLPLSDKPVHTRV